MAIISSVEFWTSAFYLRTEPGSKAKSEAQYYFESEVFYFGTSRQIPEYLASRHQAALAASVPFIVILSISGDPKWLPEAISSLFPSPETGPMSDILDVNKWEPGTVVLPVMEKGVHCMHFFMQYPAIEKANSNVKFYPVATRIYASSSYSPVILMVCRDHEVPKRLQEQCVSTNWKVQDLLSAPCRIFIDLFEFLGEWPSVWSSARHELAKRNAELQGNNQKLDVLQRTKVLHSDTANVIALREDLRLHIAAFQKFQSLIRTLETKGSPLVTSGLDDAREYLRDRTEQCLQNLYHQQESSVVIHRQLENLLSLAFNTEMVSQGQAVARLNTLAFAFLPLSYVATLFGMTNLSISARWYPVGATIVLSVLLMWSIITSQLPKWRLTYSRKRPLKQHPTFAGASKQDIPSTSAAPTRNENFLQSASAPSLRTERPVSNPSIPSPTVEPILYAKDPHRAPRKWDFLQRLNPLARRKRVLDPMTMPVAMESMDFFPAAPRDPKIALPSIPEFLSVSSGPPPPPPPVVEMLPVPSTPDYKTPRKDPYAYGVGSPSSSATPLLNVPNPSASVSSSGATVGSERGYHVDISY